MKAKRRRHAPEFKARVALEALKGVQTIQQIAKQFDVHPVQVSEWKKTMSEGAPGVFGTDPVKNSKEDFDQERDKLHSKIGQLSVEVDFLRKKSKQLGLWTENGDRQTGGTENGDRQTGGTDKPVGLINRWDSKPRLKTVTETGVDKPVWTNRCGQTGVDKPVWTNRCDSPEGRTNRWEGRPEAQQRERYKLFGINPSNLIDSKVKFGGINAKQDSIL